MSVQPSILVGLGGGKVWVRVHGKGSFQNSPGLREFAREMAGRGHHDFVIDLQDCTVMDSTFMGTLAGIALQLKGEPAAALRVINLNERNHDLLTNLGLDHLFTIEAAPREPTDSASAPPVSLTAVESAGDRETRGQTMLEAHEALVEASPENFTRFKDVLEFLKHDLKQESSE